MPIVLKAIDLEEVFDDDEFLLAWVGKSIEEGRSLGDILEISIHIKNMEMQKYTLVLL